MVTSKQLPTGSVVVKPKRGGVGAGIIALLMIILAGAVALAGVGLFVPVRLAVVHEQALGLLHGGIVASVEETYVDGCVPVDGAEGLQAITRTRRLVSYVDGTTLEVVFSGRPAPTNACP